MTIAAPIPIQIVRTYRSVDKNSGGAIYGAFGLGTTLNYDTYLYSSSEDSNGRFDTASIVLPDGGQITCPNTDAACTAGSCSSYQTAKFVCNQQPVGAWFNAKITYDATVPLGGGWDALRKDGTHYKFGFGAPLQSIQDRYGNFVKLTRGDGTTQRGNVMTITASNGRSLTLNYGGTGNCCIVSYGANGSGDAAGRKITYSYTGSKQLQTVTWPNIDSRTQVKYQWSPSYPTLLSVIRTTLIKPGGTTVTDVINPNYDQNTTIHRLNAVYPGNTAFPGIGVQYAYTASGGNITSMNTSFPDGTHRKLSFDAAGYITQDVRNSSNAANTETINYTRDSAERTTQIEEVEDPQHRKTKFVYDADANITSESLLNSAGTTVVSNTYEYDYTKFDQIKTLKNGLGKIWTVGLDSVGNPITVTDPLQRTWCATYNSAGLVKTVTDPAVGCTGTPLETFSYYPNLDLQYAIRRATTSETTTFGYDLVGRPTSIISPLNEQTTIEYDDQDDVTTVIDPYNHSTSYAYSWNGNLNQLTDANGHITTWNWSPPDTTSSWDVKECDQISHCAEYLVEGMTGALDRYVDRRGVTTNFDYDNLGRMISVDYDVHNVLGNGTYSDTFAYDFANNLIGIKHPATGNACTGSDGKSYTDSFTYDLLNNPLTTCTPEGTVTNQFDTIGRRTQMQPTGANAIRYGWDDANQLTSLTELNGTTSASISYYPDGQRQTLSVSVPGTTVTTNYSYDPLSQHLSRIAYASTQNSALGLLNFSYDADGRVTGKTGGLATVNLPAASSTMATYLPTNQINTWTNGTPAQSNQNESLQKDPASGNSYAYDAREQLTTALGVTYAYDASGRRESVIFGGQTTKYLYDGETPIQVTGANTTKIIVLPESIEILNINGVVPIHDALGSVLGGINSSGAFQYQYKYDPFGGFTPIMGTAPSGYGNVYGMAGIEYDPTGLYHANARYYSPLLQRFLSEDPIRGSANMFAYGGNSPIGNSDGSGMFPLALAGEAGAIAGIGIDANPIEGVLLTALYFSGVAQPSRPQPFYSAMQVAQLNAKQGLTFESQGLDRGGVYTPGGQVLNVRRWKDFNLFKDWWIIRNAGDLADEMVAAVEEALEGEEEVSVVAQNGTKVKGFMKHGVDRVIGDTAERAGVKPGAILDALKNPTSIKSGVRDGLPFQAFTGKDAQVVVNPEPAKL